MNKRRWWGSNVRIADFFHIAGLLYYQELLSIIDVPTNNYRFFNKYIVFHLLYISNEFIPKANQIYKS